MKLFTSEEMRGLDSQTVHEYGIPSILLMEHAGHEIALEARSLLQKARGTNVIVLCGPGNNGGDGFAAARILCDLGFHVVVFLHGDPAQLKSDPAIQCGILKRLGVEIFTEREWKRFQETLERTDIVIDALFGTGLKRRIEGNARDIISCVNEMGKTVLSVDLPSGIDSDSGKILGEAIRATVTVTLGAPKPGLFLYPGREFAGEIKIAYIAIPRKAVEQSPCKTFLVEKNEVSSWLPRWKPNLHKGEKGRVMIIGGSRGLSGAPSLSAIAALESGAGLVYVAIPDGIRNLMEHKLTDAVKIGLPQTKDWILGKISLPATREWFDRVHAMAIGPGIGRAIETGEYARNIIEEYRGPLVVDADGLYPLDEAFLEANGRTSLILTPHEGEMGRICGLSTEEVRANRFELAQEKAKKWNVTLLLKGASTIIATPFQAYINPTGNSGMAVGGSGDVLTGLIASLLAQGMETEKAAAAAAFIHGRTGDILKEKIGLRGITALKISRNLFRAFRELEPV